MPNPLQLLFNEEGWGSDRPLAKVSRFEAQGKK
jgi:hypothetical protein